MLNTHFVPAAEKGSGWLMIVLHGLGDSSAGFQWLPSALDLSWLNYLLVDAPDPYYTGFSWYEFSGNSITGILRSRQELSHLLAEQATRGFSPGQTFLSGFSQGSLMTLETGLRYPEILAGLIGISGYVFDLPSLLQELSPVATQQRILMTHGRQDTMIPFRPVREQVAELKKNGLKVEWHELDKGHTIAGEKEMSLIRNFIRGARKAR